MSDAALAASIAEDAGKLLLDLRSTSGLAGKELGKAGDAQSNVLICGRLALVRPHDAVLSEESADDPIRLQSDRVWIVDPLDGTREYGMAGRNDWAVHVALWERSRQITAAAVAQPALDVVYRSDQLFGARTAGASDAIRMVVSDSRPPAFMDALADALSGEFLVTVGSMGSAGAKAMAVLRGDVDAYVHAGGQWEWDSAAPVGVVLAHGLHASRIDGSPLIYNEAHPYLPDLLICREELATDILNALRAVSGQHGSPAVPHGGANAT
jgi:3'(2'), 5'-bisphosphate nucleotidase